MSGIELRKFVGWLLEEYISNNNNNNSNTYFLIKYNNSNIIGLSTSSLLNTRAFQYQNFIDSSY